MIPTTTCPIGISGNTQPIGIVSSELIGRTDKEIPMVSFEANLFSHRAHWTDGGKADDIGKEE
jgi:hypothetical protein